MKSRASSRGNDRGSILIYALWICALLSLFVFSAGYSARQRLRVVGRIEDRIYLRDGAQSAVERALWSVNQTRMEPPYESLNGAWSVNKSFFHDIRAGRTLTDVLKAETLDADTAKKNSAFAFGLSDEESKINLNVQKKTVDLRRLFQLAAGVDDRAASILADSLLDWMDEDDDLNPDGAESAYYRSLKVPIRPKNGPLVRYEEIRSMRGMTSQIYASLLPYVTVYGDGRINLNTASPTVLQVAGVSKVLVDAIDLYRRGFDHALGTADDHVFTDLASVTAELAKEKNVDADELKFLDELIQKKIFKITSAFFIVQSRTRLDSGRQELRVESVIKRGIGILSWREYFRHLQQTEGAYRMTRYRGGVIFLILVVSLGGPMHAADTPVAPPLPLNGKDINAKKGTSALDEIKLVAKAMGVIDEAFVNDVTLRNLVYDAVKGMLAGLGDRYTEFIDPKRYELLQIQLRGEYAGIGVILEILDKFPVIKGVKPGSSAQKVGLKPRDKILKINQDSVEGLPLTEVAPRLRGDAGTHLTLTIERPPLAQILEIEVVRETIELEAVSNVRMVGKSAGYFWLQEWQDKTVAQVDKVLEDLRKQGMKALIIDLRGNGGGLLPSAVALAERFLKKGEGIVLVSSKIAEQRKDYICTGEKTIPGLELVVLVNEKSASASEIFSAALQDQKRATIVGVQTFGKASVQSVVPLDGKSAIKMTTARYKSPKGRTIDQIGLTPDVVVAAATPGGPDFQLIKAMDLLKKYL